MNLLQSPSATRPARSPAISIRIFTVGVTGMVADSLSWPPTGARTQVHRPGADSKKCQINSKNFLHSKTLAKQNRHNHPSQPTSRSPTCRDVGAILPQSAVFWIPILANFVGFPHKDAGAGTLVNTTELGSAASQRGCQASCRQSP